MAGPLLSISVSTSAQADLRRVLDAKQFKSAIYNAVVRTTSRAKRIAGDAVAEQAPIRRKLIDGKSKDAAIVSRIIKGSEPQGRIVTRDKPLPLSAFKFRQNKNGVTVQLDKGKPGVTFRHAFVANVKAGRSLEDADSTHKGIFVRKRIIASAAGNYARRGHTSMAKAAESGQVTPAGFAWRLPMRQLYGESVWEFINKTDVKAAIESKLGPELMKQIDSQVKRFLSGKANTLAEAVAQLEDDDQT